MPSWSPYRTAKVLCHAGDGVFAGAGSRQPGLGLDAAHAGGPLEPAGLGHVPQLLDELVHADLGRPELPGHPPAVDDDHSLADLVDVEEVVIDEDAGLAGVLDPADEVERLPGLGHRQPHRRLVEDDQLGLEVERPGDRDALALAARHRADERVGRDRLRREAQELEHQLLGFGAHRRHVEQPDAARPLAAHEDVPPERLLVGQGPLLVDGLDPEVAGALHREVMDLLSLPPDRAGVGRVEPGDDLDQRRLAGAVVAEQPDDLVDADRDADVLQRADMVERLRDVLELEEVRRRRLHGRLPEFRRERRRDLLRRRSRRESRVGASCYLISRLTRGMSGATLPLLMIPDPVSM